MLRKTILITFVMFALLQGCASDSDPSLDEAHEVNLVVIDFSQQVEGARGGTAYDINVR